MVLYLPIKNSVKTTELILLFMPRVSKCFLYVACPVRQSKNFRENEMLGKLNIFREFNLMIGTYITHIVEITALCCHNIFAKIPSNQLFY